MKNQKTVRFPSPLMILSSLMISVCLFSSLSVFADTKSVPSAKQKPYGIEKRVEWNTSKVRGRPEPPLPFKAKRVFPHLTFKNPTVLTSAPGTDRLFLTENSGKIYSIPADQNCKQADLFLDVKDLVAQLNKSLPEKERVAMVANYGLTFHPQFAENRYCYLCYVVRYIKSNLKQHPHGTRVVRLQVTKDDPPRAIATSELEIISWLQGGHNGGCLKFGHDGKLFISTGDGAPAYPPDEHKAGQDVSNLLSATLRIDVDQPSDKKPYSIPADNPFVNEKGARGEIWAYGLRNPWKISFDRKTGDLWIGDVGWQLWEMVYHVQRGDNFGWSLVEGPQQVHTEWERGPTPVVKATVEIPHSEGASVTGGFVYRGTKFPELYGRYIFGDYVTRRIWHISSERGKPGPRNELVEPTVRIAGFAERHDGELLLLDYDAGTIHELERNQLANETHPFPHKLSESGLFESVSAHRPAPGVIPFSINSELWADHATAERFLALPGDSSIGLYTKSLRLPGSYFRSDMFYPENAVLAKTLSLELVAGDANSKKRIETQLLHFNGLEWRGYSYRWNQEQTDAELVGAAGETATFNITDANYPGGKRAQQWRFSSRTECMRCHNAWAGSTLAFNVKQINRNHNFGSISDNQIRTLRHIGVLENRDDLPLVTAPFESIKPHLPETHLPQLVDPFDETADLYLRGRSYLHANCAHCHREHGGGAARIHIDYEKPLEKSEALGVRPTQGTFGIHKAEILAPGDPYRSVMLMRMAKRGPGHMPHIGSTIIDRRGLALIHDWIQNLPQRTALQTKLKRLMELDEATANSKLQLEREARQQLLARSYAKLENRDSVNAEDRSKAAKRVEQEIALQSTKRKTEREKLIDELTASTEGALLLASAQSENKLPDGIARLVVERTTSSKNMVARDLFESFLPDSKRVKRLGKSINAKSLLALKGDSESGKNLFFTGQSISCRNCHQVSGKGESLGPELTHVAKKLTKAQILENILQPSKTIDPKFRTWIIETTAGKVYSGLMVKQTKEEIIIRDAKRKEHRFKTSEVENAVPQQKSLMPELLLSEMSAKDVADLLAWLSTLK